MNLSELCIRRPVMTVLLTMALVLAGLAAYGRLPVASLPQVDFPTINVTAQLPGASPETMASSVASVLEREFSTIAGIDSMTATSIQGSTQITLQFVLDRNIDSAAADVQAGISRALRRLPQEMTNPPAYRKVNPADQAVFLLALRSETLPLSAVTTFADTIVSPRLSTLAGVAQVQVYGSQKYAVRIELDPDALVSRGIGIDEIQKAVVTANANTPVGVISGTQRTLVLETDKPLLEAAGFGDIVVAWRNGAPVRLQDVARVVDSVENTRLSAWFNGTRAIVLGVLRQPDANTVEVVDRVRAQLPSFRAEMPPAMELSEFADRSQSIRDAVEDVQFTLILTIGLVILVILLFLRRLSATLIPGLAIPVSLIATFGGMYVLGHSIDNVSLMALTLSVGLVVDDAIVMLENIVRHGEEGMSPWEAALTGSREIGFTIVSITVSLVAVFLPIFLMGGVIGRLFQEFAWAVTLALGFSALVSLTLTPMLCARWLKHHGPGDDANGRGLGAALERFHQGWLALYASTLDWVLRYRLPMLLVTAATIVGTVVLFRTVPKGFFPLEDSGQISITTEGAQDISFTAMAELHHKAAALVQADPAITTVMASVGSGTLNSPQNQGRMQVNLLPRDQRPPMGVVIQRLRKSLAAIPGLSAYLQPVQTLRFGGRVGKNLYQYTVQSVDLAELYKWADTLANTLRTLPELQDVTDDSQRGGQSLMLDIDRDKAAALGVAVDQVRSMLYSAFGPRQISTIYTAAADYPVILELAPGLQGDERALSRLYVRAASGKLVPLATFVQVHRTTGPLAVNHQGQLPAVTLSFNLTPGVSLGAAIDSIHGMERRLGLPATVSTRFSGTAQIFRDAQGNQGLLLLAAIAAVYIVLGVLYESYLHPITILSGLPSAAVGALATLYLTGGELDVIAVIGLIMLIGIVKKNAIMMIDCALALQRGESLPPLEAIRRACLLRFRPIMMTTMAALMGTLPIALGSGASSELRQPLGLVVVGGLLVSQLLTLYITPVLYVTFESLGSRLRWAKKPEGSTGSGPERIKS